MIEKQPRADRKNMQGRRNHTAKNGFFCRSFVYMKGLWVPLFRKINNVSRR